MPFKPLFFFCWLGESGSLEHPSTLQLYNCWQNILRQNRAEIYLDFSLPPFSMLPRKKIGLGCQKVTSTLSRGKEGEESKFGICLIIYVHDCLIFSQFCGNQEIDLFNVKYIFFEFFTCVYNLPKNLISLLGVVKHMQS